jgi:hypothetical protein
MKQHCDTRSGVVLLPVVVLLVCQWCYQLGLNQFSLALTNHHVMDPAGLCELPHGLHRAECIAMAFYTSSITFTLLPMQRLQPQWPLTRWRHTSVQPLCLLWLPGGSCHVQLNLDCVDAMGVTDLAEPQPVSLSEKTSLRKSHSMKWAGHRLFETTLVQWYPFRSVLISGKPLTFSEM